MVVGYKRYLTLIADLTEGKELISSGMTKERERCLAAIERADQGATVALISSEMPDLRHGRPGVGTGGRESEPLPIEIVAGVTAAGAAAARLGAPLMLDFACISLSDLLVPWENDSEETGSCSIGRSCGGIIQSRSKKRSDQLEEAASIFKKYREGRTPVGIGTAVGTEDEEIELSDLDHFLALTIT